MHSSVTDYIIGAKQWRAEMELVRKLILVNGLTEEFKWKSPCYTYKEANVLMIGNFKAYCTISFFKGVLFKDEEKLLKKPGENSQSVRMFTFTNVEAILQQEATIKAYIYEAIGIEEAGLKVPYEQSKKLDFPAELIQKIQDHALFKTAFEALSHGRQRGYNLFFSSAKQTATRSRRIEKYAQRIIDGFGINDCVCGLSKKTPNCDGSHKTLAEQI
ncbi:MAG: hypothetical protein ACJAT1_002088 [Marivirga sp.]|jgi:uncharacterized protein YdeI (YjbR/CyaY-like superfamily)